MTYKPYFDPNYEFLMERLHPPTVCVDNDTCRSSTLVKVDSANKHGVLLEMVQVLTDLDLLISKSYISSDGGWFMDVFHVTDQHGKQITDPHLIHYIQEAICATRMRTKKVQPCIDREMRPRHVSTENTTLEITGTNRPGLLSMISAVLIDLRCHVSTAVAWTHHSRAACIIYVEDVATGQPIIDPCRVADIQSRLEIVVADHHYEGERRSVRLAVPTTSRTHTERRLHQLMAADRDYEECDDCSNGGDDSTTVVTIDECRQKGYSTVIVKSRNRPKLLFDTVCTLTDMQYVVFHANISAEKCRASQEYYIRQKGGWILSTENERRRIKRCLIAAVKRRVSHGVRLDISTENRIGLLSEVTRRFCENGLSIARAEIGMRGERAVGSFYVTDVSGNTLKAETVEALKKEFGGSLLVVNNSSELSPQTSPNKRRSSGIDAENRPRFSLGGLLWSQIERIFGNFKPIKS